MNKPANLGRCLWPAAARSRFPAPIGSETSAMPCDHGRRLENCQRVTHAGDQAIETSENEPIDVTEDKALRRLTPKHIDLMAKNEIFGLQRRARPEQPGHKTPNQLEEVDHLEVGAVQPPMRNACRCAARRKSSARIGSSTHLGVTIPPMHR